MLRAATVILRKDLRLRFRDRSVLLFAFVVPLALTFVFSQLFPTQEEFRLTAGVVDLDGGEVAAGFTAGVLAELAAQDLADVTRFEDEAAARAALQDGTIAAAWILPPGFSASVAAGDGGEMRVLLNPDRALAGGIAQGIAEGYRAEINRIGLAVGTRAAATGGTLSVPDVEQITQRAREQMPMVTTTERFAADERLDPVSYLAAGMAVFFLFFTVTFGITGLLEERQQGTLQRLLAAPIGVGAVHLGKALGAFVLGIVSMTVLAIASATLLGASWGDPAGVAVLVVAGVVSALGVMAFVASFARTAEQAGNLQSIVALIFGLAGGVFFPVGVGALGRLALLSPHGWFLRGLGDLVGSDRWTSVLPAAGALVAFGIVFAVPGVLRMRRETL